MLLLAQLTWRKQVFENYSFNNIINNNSWVVKWKFLYISRDTVWYLILYNTGATI